MAKFDPSEHQMVFDIGFKFHRSVFDPRDKPSSDSRIDGLDTPIVPFVPDPDTHITEPMAAVLRGDVIYAVDFGNDKALAIHGPEGEVIPPKFKSTSQRFRFIDILRFLMIEDARWRDQPGFVGVGHVVFESPTVGSSGVEVSDVEAVASESKMRVFQLTSRVTISYKKDHNIPFTKRNSDDDDDEVKDDPQQHKLDATILYRIALERPQRLKVWRPVKVKLERQFTAVRPYDKRDYDDPVCDKLMQRLPLFNTLKPELQRFLSIGKHTEYSRPKTIPLLMALEDSAYDGTRKGYERVLGLYDHGYSCFYRRKTVDLMQAVAKDIAAHETGVKVSSMKAVSPAVRKEAWKATRRNIRRLYHLIK